MENKLINIDKVSVMNKTDLQERGKQDARLLMDEGFTNAVNLVALARKAIAYLTSYHQELDSDARTECMGREEVEALGVKFSLSSTGDRLNYDLDQVYADLKQKLKDREMLLKTAKKMDNEIFDGDGVAVPKLPLKAASKEILRAKL